MDAAWNGHAQVVMQLVAMKANTDLVNNRQNTALHFAYMCEHVEVIEFLESLEIATTETKISDQPKSNKSGRKGKHRKTSSTSSVNGPTSKPYVSPVVKIQAQYRGKKSQEQTSNANNNAESKLETDTANDDNTLTNL